MTTRGLDGIRMWPWPPTPTRVSATGDYRGRSIVRRIGGVATLVLTGAAAYFCFWPVPADPRSWSAPTPPGYVGAHLANARLAGLRTIDIGNEFGPEHIAMGPDGKLYAAMTSGSLLRMDPDGGGQEVFANTGGRVLGFAFDAEGRMIAADAMKGLLAVTPDARVTVLTDRVSATDPIRYANSIVVAPDGVISFRGTGECVALGIDVPGAVFGGDTDPSGYTQASMAPIRLWKAR